MLFLRCLTMTVAKQQRNLLVVATLSLIALAYMMTTMSKCESGQQFYDVVARPIDESSKITRLDGYYLPLNDGQTKNNDEYMSACLFLDPTGQENHDSQRSALTEWLAYHYQVLPLRYLIVASINDTASSSFTTDVFGNFRSHYLPSSLQQKPIILEEWTEEDYLTKKIVHRFAPPLIATREERQGIFYYRCLQALQEHHRNAASLSAWTWLASNVHEYLVLTSQEDRIQKQSKPVSNISIPDSILHAIQSSNQHELPSTNMLIAFNSTNHSSAQPRVSFPKLPHCIQMNSVEAFSNEKMVPNHLPNIRTVMLAVNTTSSFGMSHVRSARVHAITHNISSTLLLDLTRILPNEIVPFISNKVPATTRNKSGCRHVDFLSVIIREDPKDTKKKRFTPTSMLDLRPWLPSGFAHRVDKSVAMDLPTSHQNVNNHKKSNESSCALLFFGLPRAYDTMVLPSIVRNLLIPNARHNCDVFVHYYYMTAEPAGRMNEGGSIDPTAILKLADAVRLVAQNYTRRKSSRQDGRIPHVAFTHDTDESFWYLRNTTVQKYRTTKDKQGQLLYFPWNAKSYTFPSSLDNIVKQWHSIESVWNLMERAMRQGIANYTRVGLFRSDVMYVTPIDIYRTSLDDPNDDLDGRYAVVPPFALYPVNDRMVYGPYKAVKIWATKRFDYIEDHVRNPKPRWGPGYGMHSELFVDTILTAMSTETGINVTMSPDICFFRTRQDNSTMISDCDTAGKTRGIENMDKERVVKDITGFTNCTKFIWKAPFEALKCSKKK